MKRIVLLIILAFSIKLYPYEISPLDASVSFGLQNHFPLTEEFDVKKMFQTASIDYGIYALVNRYVKFGGGAGGVFLLGPQAKFVDLFSTAHFTIYPFQDYAGLVFTVGLSPTFLILNNISFISSAKLIIDIPIARENYITISSGVLYRGFIPMIDYIDFEAYSQNLSSYFVGIEYKLLLKANKSPMKKYDKNFNGVA